MSLPVWLRFACLLVVLLFVSPLGCHQIECETDEDCPGNLVCVGSSVCPPDVVCIWEGEPGYCDLAAETLCNITQGEWDEISCEHYDCGQFPACDAIIPGCNCGPDRNFIEAVGCVQDPACRGSEDECRSDKDCASGNYCNPCPPDPTCPLCPACGPPVCEPIACDFDEDCPKGSECVGSSVCPRDVVCIWAGEPGGCEPL
jgi:hypothetical protein